MGTAEMRSNRATASGGIEPMAATETPREADARLIAAFLQKDATAAHELVDRYASRILGLGLRLLTSRTDAEDLVQDTFLKLLRRGSSFDHRRGSLDVWIMMNARSLAIDRLRRRTLDAKLSPERMRSEASDEPGPERHAEQSDQIQRARTAMQKLPSGQRSAVELVYLRQRSTREVADLQGIPRGTVKSRIGAGIATLRRSFFEGDDAA
jgi:RNA polymerase sigma-70 factor (ECF subfamily)